MDSLVRFIPESGSLFAEAGQAGSCLSSTFIILYHNAWLDRLEALPAYRARHAQIVPVTAPVLALWSAHQSPDPEPLKH